jgi:glutamate 5-kinase
MSATIVVKVGTSSLTASAGRLALGTIGMLVQTLSELQRSGERVILVSSGAVGVGCARLGLAERPTEIAQKQAAAAIGQGRLMRIYDDLFAQVDCPIAQVLLTRNDLSVRRSHLNINNTFQALLDWGVIPIVNENDTVAVDELKFGDNDTLSARVASLVNADWLFLLTDVDRLYSADPRQVPDAQPIAVVEKLSDLAAAGVKTGDPGSRWGTGGMVTKIMAAEIATAAGVKTVITNGSHPDNIRRVLAGESVGTLFLPVDPSHQIGTARKRWIAHGTVPAGKLYVDDGAAKAIATGGRSLLAAGLVRVEGEFAEYATVGLWDLRDREIGRGLSNYSSGELRQICGAKSADITAILGRTAAKTIVHRDNLALSSSWEVDLEGDRVVP